MTILKAAIAAMVAAFVVGTAGVARAAPSKWEPLHGEGADVVENFCGVPGLTVQETFVADGRFRITNHGPDGLPYYASTEADVNTFTNVATGAFVYSIQKFRSTDHKITDNGDGTWTVLVQNTGTINRYNQDGQRIGHNAGLFSYEVLIDYGGTPTDPSDDVFLGFIRVVKEVGTHAELCAVYLPFLG